jgi:hypothetical protein
MGILGMRQWTMDGAYQLGGMAVADPYFANVVLLCGFDGIDGATSTTDEATGKAITFVGNAQLDTAQSKFGLSSLLLDGNGDGLSLADSADFDLGADQFTIEAFARFASISGDQCIISQWPTGSLAWSFRRNSTGTLVFLYSTTGSDSPTAVSSSWTPTTGQWYHLAVDRDASNKFRLYIEGVMVASGTVSATIFNSTGAVNIGANNAVSGRYFNGWLDEVRITKGVARYASDSGFTVPAAAFPRS